MIALKKAEARYLITGGSGLVGRALTEQMRSLGATSVVSLSSSDCDLRDRDAVAAVFKAARPDFVFHLAARVYGLGGNAAFKSDVLVDNVLINTNVIEQSRLCGTQKIIAMGSGCVYPELGDRSELCEDQVWLGPPHSSEDSYAHAKRLMLAHLNATREQHGTRSAFVISGNLYGPHDNFNTETGHVIPSLIAKFHRARATTGVVSPWGSGIAMRDFTHANDMAAALLHVLENFEGVINIGSGYRHRIEEIVTILAKLTGVQVSWDRSKPDGQLHRYYNLDKVKALGFTPRWDLVNGVIETYKWYDSNTDIARN